MEFDGSNPDLPIYLAIDGKVFDVTAGKEFYSKNSGYGSLAGKDGSRSFVTGCFGEFVTHDVRGLSEKELVSLNEWVEFYENHKKYFYVGRVEHPPIDPRSPLPADCRENKGEKSPKP
jgi:hypothetical protein